MQRSAIINALFYALALQTAQMPRCCWRSLWIVLCVCNLHKKLGRSEQQDISLLSCLSSFPRYEVGSKSCVWSVCR